MGIKLLWAGTMGQGDYYSSLYPQIPQSRRIWRDLGSSLSSCRSIVYVEPVKDTADTIGAGLHFHLCHSPGQSA